MSFLFKENQRSGGDSVETYEGVECDVDKSEKTIWGIPSKNPGETRDEIIVLVLKFFYLMLRYQQDALK
jgi:hypothetical protein